MEAFNSNFSSIKEKSLFNRYICNEHIETLLNNLPADFSINTIGYSVNKLPIYSVQFGNGSKRVLLWSQMHGNESTTTKALFDVFNYFIDAKDALAQCTLLVIPILNPDGAKAYTRLNANAVDLNRDAQDLSQPESKVLREVLTSFKPHFCFNLHGQRTIFSAGKNNVPATLSFLSPAQDKDCSITENRKVSMEIIAAINKELQKIIPGQVGVYDDAFNINCVGDTFQSLNVPTILFEAGHYKEDYEREETRRLIFISLLVALGEIANNHNLGANFEPYLEIPENEKLFFDIIIRNASIKNKVGSQKLDIAIQYEETLIDGRVAFIPKIRELGNLTKFYGHREIDAKNSSIELPKGVNLNIENSIDFVMIDGVKYSLNLTKS